MKINKFFLSLFLLMSISLFAQSSAMQLRVSENFTDADNFKLNIEMDLGKALQSGFLLQLPTVFKATPTAVFNMDRELWLKQINSIPEKPGIVHWIRYGDGLLFLFAEGTLGAGSKLQIRLQAFSALQDRNDARIVVYEIQEQNARQYSVGSQLNQAVLFQNENNEIR